MPLGLDGVNSGLEMNDDGSDTSKYAMKYADIIKGEIGSDTINS
jgi:hypothetical protein